MNNKVAMVTGGGSGIGRAIAVAFAKKGANIVIADISVEGGKETVRLVKQEGGNATFIKTDVTQNDEVKSLIDQTVKLYGGLDYAINNAGVESQLTPIHETPLETWDFKIAVNLTGVFLCMKHEITYMLEHGGGSIVNTSSIAGLVGAEGAGPYVSAKHGVTGLTKAAALEYALQGIRVNSVHPGGVKTPLITQMIEMMPEVQTQLDAMHPMGRIGEPAEVADAVVWLCSDEASFVTGHQMVMDGGYLSQ